ncbi:YfhL family 4Fe-4S dicluster ferredoxin [Psychrobium sp. nBUS_13]|uniref:YfhL family 4Fe-4S dicluster ferredoxin n=1 Tax=Psychrobium sp. nBUS_13 TaxID=3395319 RepID=UPI003EC0C7B4
MALKILNNCINCDMCEPECPNQAISYGEVIYEIDQVLCTECVGHYDKPTCIAVCPIDCNEVDQQHVESQDSLYDKYVTIHHSVLL